MLPAWLTSSTPPPADLTSFIHQQMPLSALLGVEGLEMDPASVRLALPWRADLCTAGGRLHGGALMALADSAGAALRLREPARGPRPAHGPSNRRRTSSVASEEGAVVATATAATRRFDHHRRRDRDPLRRRQVGGQGHPDADRAPSPVVIRLTSVPRRIEWRLGHPRGKEQSWDRMEPTLDRQQFRSGRVPSAT